MSFIIYLILVSTGIGGQCISGIPLNLPERNAFGEVHLISTLTNQDTGDVTSMEEWLSTRNLDERGKIQVTRKDSSFTIFYNEDDHFRLVMTDTDCEVFSYNGRNWNKHLPTVDSDLENVILMFGPTIYYRIRYSLIGSSDGSSPLVWMKGNPVVTRGIQMDTAFTEIEEALNVTVYKQGLYLNDDPFRVDFEGFLPEVGTSGSTSLYSVDFYLVETVDDLSYQVAPTPGIGCVEYLEKSKPFPSEADLGLSGAFKYSVVEVNAEGDQISIQIFVDPVAKIVRYLADYGETLVETIFDYNLGIQYALGQPRCVASAITEDDLGVAKAQFSVKELLWIEGDFNYLGRFLYAHRSGIICDVWEQVDYEVSYEGVKYAKLVTTQYFTEKSDLSGFVPFNKKQTPIGMTRTYYSSAEKNVYHPEVTLRRDIYDFSPSILETEYETTFQLLDCDNENQDKLWLRFEIKPADPLELTKDAIKAAEYNLVRLREGLRDVITKSIRLSPLRMADVDFDFTEDSIEARILFTERPRFTDGLIREVKKIDLKSIQPYPEKFDSFMACVSNKAHLDVPPSFLWCQVSNTDHICAPVDDISSLKTYTGTGSVYCDLYTHPVGTYRDLVEEIDLSKVHEELIDRLNSMLFTIGPAGDERPSFRFKVTNVLYSDETEGTQSSKLLFERTFPSAKLKSTHPLTFTPDSSITTIGDCYHLCESSEAIDCTGFSFCVTPTDQAKVLCSLTSSVLAIADDKTREAIEPDSDCNLYTKNHILDFIKISDRQILSTATSELLYSVEECAAQCAASGECKSFHYCQDSICALSSKIYTLQSSESNPNCDSYTLKKTENFKLTGTELVNDVTFVEEGVNLDQCASLCFDYGSGGDKCISFNYCPKGRTESTCQLSQSKLVSKRENDQGKVTNTSANCYHYELNEGPSSDVIPSRGATYIVSSAGGGLLAIVIVVCLVVGFIYGFVGEYVYLKMSKKLRTRSSQASRVSTTISWSRQVNEQS